uniref:Uncharacterized protein n=1 Tax=Magallana gigas TaxID=29159 RepID=A0A8W8JUF2_MAGGI
MNLRGRKLMKLSKRQDLDQHLDRVGYHTKNTRSVQSFCVYYGNPSRSYGGKCHPRLLENSRSVDVPTWPAAPSTMASKPLRRLEYDSGSIGKDGKQILSKIGTGRDPPNGRGAKKGKSNRNGKPRCMNEINNIREEAELGRDLENGTTPYSVPFKINVSSAVIANEPIQVGPNRKYELRSMWKKRYSGTHLIIM